MDILVLDAPMKFIHGKMIEQGANEWSRYLTNQFNPIGRGTLYRKSFDKEQGLKVYLYSAAITLECVGEAKGYLKVVKAEETNVLTYHKAIEEGKVLEEKITFVPIYKFQYINGKEHHDVDCFMQDEKEKRDFENYVELWQEFMSEGHNEESLLTDLKKQPGVEQALKCLYDGKTAHKNMSNFMPTVEKLEVFDLKALDSDCVTAEYACLSDEKKDAIKQALATQDLYFMDAQDDMGVMPLIREIVQQVNAKEQKTLIVAPDAKQVEEVLQDIENHCETKVMQLIEVDKDSDYTLEHQVNALRESVLYDLTEEASKYNKQKEEFNQMKAECDIYEYAEKTIKLAFDILEVLEEINQEKVILQQESLELGKQGESYVEALEKYEALSKIEHETYRKLKEEIRKNDNLYDEILWMKSYREVISYQEYKELILKYSKAVQEFEEKLSAYKSQMGERSAYEAKEKALETKLLEARRQYLNLEALRSINPNAEMEEDGVVQEGVKRLEQELAQLRQNKEEVATGIISTRYLDEMKKKVYKLKDEVEAYMNEFKPALITVSHKEEITKADIINIFKRMQKIEKLFEDENTYTTYLEGVEEYLELEEVVEQNQRLLESQEQNQEKMSGLLRKQQEVESLLETKLEEETFKAFLKIIDEVGEGVQGILQAPVYNLNAEKLEKLQVAVQQRAFKLEIYKEKVAFYDALAKLKEDWKSSLEADQQILVDYLASKINVVGTTNQDMTLQVNTTLLREDFDYVILYKVQDMLALEPLISMIKGKKVILIGDSTKNPASLFTKLYSRCLTTHKKVLVEG